MFCRCHSEGWALKCLYVIDKSCISGRKGKHYRHVCVKTLFSICSSSRRFREEGSETHLSASCWEMHQWNNDNVTNNGVWNYNREKNINMNHLLVTQLSLIEALSVSLFCQTLLPVFSYLVFLPLTPLLFLSLTAPKVTFKNLQMYWRFLQRWWLLCLRRMNLNKSPGPVCLVGCVLILFWEHTGAVSASALPLPRNCHLAGRLPVLCTAQEDNEHSDRSRVSCSEYHTQAL